MIQWQDLDEDCYPDDEVEVLWLERFNNGCRIEQRVSIGKISRRCGVYGPSHAVAWAAINVPPLPGVRRTMEEMQ